MRSRSSVSVKWWGQASAVTLTPRRLPSRTSSTERAVEMCWMCSRPPVISARRMSRATMMSSAAAGMPASPSRIDSKPSFMTPPTVSSGTWQCCMITRSNILEYSRARRIRAAEATGAPSSVKATAPPATSWPRLGQFFALAALAHGADGIDVGLASALALEHDKLGCGLAVDGGDSCWACRPPMSPLPPGRPRHPWRWSHLPRCLARAGGRERRSSRGRRSVRGRR